MHSALINKVSNTPDPCLLGCRVCIPQAHKMILQWLLDCANTNRVLLMLDILTWMDSENPDMCGFYRSSYSKFKAFEVEDTSIIQVRKGAQRGNFSYSELPFLAKWMLTKSDKAKTHSLLLSGCLLQKRKLISKQKAQLILKSLQWLKSGWLSENGNLSCHMCHTSTGTHSLAHLKPFSTPPSLYIHCPLAF